MAKRPTGLIVNRWTKYGHDRLYVETPDGRKLGWYDLKTRKIYVDNPEADRVAFGKALKEWQAGTAPSRGPDRRHFSGSSRPEVDLADQRAGDGLVAVAERVRIPHLGLRTIAKVLQIRTPDQAYRVGAKGERKVGRKLDKLTKRGYRVLHNVMLPGGGDVDHLVIGPGGVWTVNTKHHKRAIVQVGAKVVFVRGQKRPYPAAANRESQRAADVLRQAVGRPINVSPMVVIHGASRVKGWLWRRPLGVAVIPSWAVRWWFGGRAVLTTADIDAVFETARRSSTWQRV